MDFGLEAAALSIPMATAMGLAFGAGPCNITCLPYLGPVFISKQHSQRQAWRTVAPFTAGRLLSYSTLGLCAGLLGEVLQSWLESPVVGWVLGLATIVVGLSLLRRRRSKGCSTTSSSNTVVIHPPGNTQKRKVLGSGLFMMGAGMALTPCAPLGTILVAASATGSATTGLNLGLGFGLGAVVIPAIVFAIGVAHFGRQLHEHMTRWQPKLEVVAATMLILLGIVTVLGWVRP